MSNIDLRYASFMATANDVAELPHPLLDRFNVVRVPNPRAEDFDVILNAIASSHVVRDTGCQIPDLFLAGDEIAFLAQVFVESSRSIRVLKKAYENLLSEVLNITEATRLLT